MKESELNKFIENIVRKTVNSINIDNRSLYESEYNLLKEFVFNLNDTYEIDETESNKSTKSFYDNKGRLNSMHIKNNIGDYKEIKFYWIDVDKAGKKTPTYTTLPDSTAKTFNTYLKLFLEYFIFLGDKFVFQPTDVARFRLYKIALTKLLDKTKWKMTILDNKIIITKND